MSQVKPKVVLLLSGGKDSLKCIEVLQPEYDVHGLCIDGIQGIEKVGAEKAAKQFGIPLDVVAIKGFDENTWNPLKLVTRDLKMGIVAIKTAKKYQSKILATGVKKSDIENPKLWWLKGFLAFGSFLLSFFGIKIIFPVWDS